MRGATSRRLPARLRGTLTRARWRKGVDLEVNFWRRWLETGGLQWPEDFRERLDPDLAMGHRLVAEKIDRLPHRSIAILDVGAGPLTALGKVVPGKDLSITPVDPLASRYDRLLDELGIEPPVRTIAGHGERLTDMFARESFDISFAQNALDHSWDPILVIENMLQVTKKSGFVLLRHMQNEGENERYGGLHQWNFDVRAGDLIIWNRRAQHNVSRIFGPVASLEAFLETEGEGNVVNAVLSPIG
jgi:SAM-dependent methyltransferase